MLLTLTFFGFLLLSFTLVLWLTRTPRSEKLVESHLSNIREGNAPKLLEGDESVFVRERMSDRIGKVVHRFKFSQRLETLILHAGSKSTVGSVVLRSLVLLVALGVAARLFLGPLPLVAAGALLGAAAPIFYLRFQRSRRLKAFNTALPDAIELMARALKAGHTVASSIEVVAEQSAEPLAAEFQTCFQQQKFGIHFRDALLEVGGRVPSKDLHFLITAILVQRETGGDLTEILSRTTEVIRERIRIEGELRTYTAQGRLTGWILGALPVGMLGLISFMTPDYSRVLFHDPLGQKLLYAAAGLILLGTFVISRIVDIKV